MAYHQSAQMPYPSDGYQYSYPNPGYYYQQPTQQMNQQSTVSLGSQQPSQVQPPSQLFQMPSSTPYLTIPLPQGYISGPLFMTFRHPSTGQECSLTIHPKPVASQPTSTDMKLEQQGYTKESLISPQTFKLNYISQAAKQVTELLTHVIGSRFIRDHVLQDVASRHPSGHDYTVLMEAKEMIENADNSTYRQWLAQFYAGNKTDPVNNARKLRLQVSPDIIELIRRARKRVRDRKAQQSVRERRLKREKSIGSNDNGKLIPDSQVMNSAPSSPSVDHDNPSIHDELDLNSSQTNKLTPESEVDTSNDEVSGNGSNDEQ